MTGPERDFKWKPVIRATLVAPSADGTCCPCAALSDPCTCAGLAAEVRCRTRSALAVLCGFAEYTSPSDPPRAYLEQTISGECCIADRGGGCKADLGNQSRNVYAGKYTYAPNGCLPTNGQTDSHGMVSSKQLIACAARPTNIVDSAARDFTPWLPPPEHYTLSASQTRKEWTYDGQCYVIDSILSRTVTGSVTAQLAREDTERAALDRAWNPPAGPVQFSNWSDPLTEWPACSALWEMRSGAQDFDFSVREAQYQLRFPALTVTHQVEDPYTGETNTETTQVTAQVEVRIYILRRPWNGGKWVLYRTETYTLTATGGQTFEADVPNERGYETAINNVKYRIIS